MQDKIKIDLETGLYIEAVHPNETGEDIIETPCLQSFNCPKWTGLEWIEGGVIPEPTPPELDETEKLKIRLDATENALLFLMEMGGM